ncbi:MAG: response regulator [Candidatus Woesearchaeota archaeon]
MNIILLDDVALHREEARLALEDILKAENPSFTEFSSPSEALAHFHREGADLILSDIVMPEMTGFEYARAVLTKQTVPIIMHTGSWSESWINKFVLNGSAQVLPIEIAGKSFMFRDFQEYQQNLEQVYQRLMVKMPSLDQIDLTRIDQINERTKGLKDSLIEYLKDTYRELWKRWKAEETTLPPEKIERISPIDFTFENTSDFLHKLRYTLGSFSFLRGTPLSPKQDYLIQKMKEVDTLVRTHLTRYLVNPEEERAYGRRLSAQDKTSFPITQTIPTKLVNREMMLAGEEHPYLVLHPQDKEEDLAERAMTILTETHSKQGIVRSASLAEDGRMPCAGFFDSLTYSNPEEFFAAVRTIRSMQGKELQAFCHHRRLNLPPTDSMYILVEPFLDRTYLGSLLEQPNTERTFLIEFQERSNPKEKKYFLCYDAIKDQVVSASLPEDLSGPKLGQALVSLYDSASRKVGVPPEETSQVEFTFDTLEGEIKVDGLQLRKFKDRVKVENTEIFNPIENVGVMGAPSEGTRFVVAITDRPSELMAMEEKARAEGYSLAYLAEPGSNPNVTTYLNQLGLLITGEGTMVQSHHYYNALMKADQVLMLERTEFESLRTRLREGTLVEYRSNGRDVSLGIVDQTHQVKLQIRDALNR